MARVVTYRVAADQTPPTADTGNYCRARAKLSLPALRELSCGVAAEMEDSADEKWLWKNSHAKLVDGFTFAMPDTETNQKEFPQVKEQAPGVGFPIARAVAIISLATPCERSATTWSKKEDEPGYSPWSPRWLTNNIPKKKSQNCTVFAGMSNWIFAASKLRCILVTRGANLRKWFVVNCGRQCSLTICFAPQPPVPRSCTTNYHGKSASQRPANMFCLCGC